MLVSLFMSDGTLLSDVSDGIATVEFGHPRGNSLPGILLRSLAAEITALGENPNVRVIVLRSTGTGPFCAGASFDELVAIENEGQGKEFFSGFSRVIIAMIRAPQFVITRVQGKAAGGAVGLVAASDYSIALAGASARLSELAVGIGPFVVGPAIERKIGLASFSAMAVDADWRDSTWCHQHGLYSQVVASQEQLDSSVMDLANRLASSNPDAVAALKSVFWAGTEKWDSLLSERAAMSGRMVLSDFTREAIARFKSR